MKFNILVFEIILKQIFQKSNSKTEQIVWWGR